MERIAIVGLACLFPGADSPEQFWQMLIEELDVRCPAGCEFDSPVGAASRGGLSSFRFDPRGYRLAIPLLEGLDRLFQWSLHVAAQALGDSGHLAKPAVLERCGVVLGQSALPTRSSYRLFAPLYRQAIERAIRQQLGLDYFGREPTSPPPATGLTGYPAAVVAQALGLAAGHYAVDAASASALYAIRLACAQLQTGRADLMLAGAVQAAEPQFLQRGFAALKALPVGGVSRPLDRNSQGLHLAEGAGMLVLKRYRDAREDNDRIYAVIPGVGLANDGQGRHLLRPNPRGQHLAFERAYTEAQIEPGSIAYVECHASGTPLGDLTELNAMESFFAPHGTAPLIGSVKSNMGHLLPASGMAGVLKVILSLDRGVIPATIDVHEPLVSEGQLFGADKLVRCATAWPDEEPRRAAVNAFGFGGANAHLLLERPDSKPESSSGALVPKLAVVGMDAWFGTANGLAVFRESLYAGRQHFVPLPEQRWRGLEADRQLLETYGLTDVAAIRGAFISDFTIDLGLAKIPPHEADQLNPQQLLMLKVADRALRDAGIARGAKVAVVIAAGAELSAAHQLLCRWELPAQIRAGLAGVGRHLPEAQIDLLSRLAGDLLHPELEPHGCLGMLGNLTASRIAALWDFTGPSFVVSAQTNSSFKALEAAQMLLATGQADAVLVGAIDLAGGIENMQQQQSARDRDGESRLVGEGAAAVVLLSKSAAQEQGKRTYAVIEAIGFAQAVEPAHLPQAVEQAGRRALEAARISPQAVGYLEVADGSVEQHAGIAGLHAIYRTGELERCALASVTANIGHTQAASGLASLVRTVLCLHERYLPAFPGWSGPEGEPDWNASPFFVPPRSQPWLTSEGSDRRIAAISSLDRDGSCTHVLVSEATGRCEQPTRPLLPHLFVLAAADREDLEHQLEALRRMLAARPLLDAARCSYEIYGQRRHLPFALTIVGNDRAEVDAQVQRAFKGIASAFEQGRTWKTPTGSYFTASPLGKEAQVAFVYPGAFSSYPGLGQDLLNLFPDNHRRLAELTAAAGRVMGERLLYSRSLHPLSAQARDALEARLTGDPEAMIGSGLVFAALYTRLLREDFHLHPRAAFGYSLGETSMLCALDVWAGCDPLCDALRASTLFKSDLCGPKQAVREFWAMPPDAVVEPDFWSSFILLAPAPAVREHLKSCPRVYLTHINAPEEVVIAGDPVQCAEAVAQLGCQAVQAPFDSVLHCEAVRRRAPEIRRITTVAVHRQPAISFYSTAGYAPIALDPASIAASLCENVCGSVDFPRLVERVYGDGLRVFIEVGPGNSCGRWVGDILEHRPHLALSINQRGTGDSTSLVRLMATLVSHRLPVNLAVLYAPPATAESTAAFSLQHTLTLGGTRLDPEALLLPAGFDWQASHQAVSREQNQPKTSPAARLLQEHLDSGAARATGAHSTFLQARRSSLEQMGKLLQLQIAVVQKLLLAAPHPPSKEPVSR